MDSYGLSILTLPNSYRKKRPARARISRDVKTKSIKTSALQMS